MSLKAIELQVALPRTQDAGKLQEQIQQRSQLTHDLAAREMQKEVEKQEKSVVKQKQKDNVKLKKDEESGTQYESPTQKEQEKEEIEEPVKMQHPYKGNKIDFSG